MQPKLRAVETQWVQHNGQQALLLQDRTGLTDKAVVVPRSLATLLSLLDGTRDVSGLRVAFQLRTGLYLDLAAVERFVAQLDEALLLESPRFAEVQSTALADFRAAPFRPPTVAGQGYPADPVELARTLDGYANGVLAIEEPATAPPVRGLVCPHIDFPRGGSTYAQVWSRAGAAVRAADLVILLGTDHSGGPGRVTLTRQSYATPFGVLPTAGDVVDALAGALGEEAAFAEELHHRREHSVELASVWLHHTRGGQPCELVPILCGSFQPFTDGLADPRADSGLEAALGVLREVVGKRRALVVASADLAHVGTAFGDTRAVGLADRASLTASDAQMLASVARADADGFLADLRRERDRRRVCGLPPIYLALRLLEGTQGETMGYAQCLADSTGGSLVSIVGAVFRGQA